MVHVFVGHIGRKVQQKDFGDEVQKFLFLLHSPSLWILHFIVCIHSYLLFANFSIILQRKENSNDLDLGPLKNIEGYFYIHIPMKILN